MKKLIKSSLIALLLLSSVNAFAGAGHSHSVSEYRIESRANGELNRLVEEKKIPSSWKDAKLLNMEKDGNEWIVNFKNSKIEDKRKQILSIYLTPYGKIKGANYKK